MCRSSGGSGGGDGGSNGSSDGNNNNNNNSRIGTAPGEIRECQLLFQRLSVTIQRFNFCTTVSLNMVIRTSSLSRLLILAFFYLLTLGIFTTKGTKK